MAFLAAAIPLIAGAVGIASGIKGLTQKSSKPPAAVKAPAAPTAQDAAIKAAEESKKRRRMMSQTDLTHGSALVPEGAVAGNKLLGGVA